MPESIQRTLTRVRPPRVRITYDVEIGDAIVKKELPFVMGIMADLSGHAAVPRAKVLAPYKERPFVYIDRDNFDAVLSDVEPALQLKSGDKPELHFTSLEDFTPPNVVKSVPALNKLFLARNLLQDMAAKLDGNDALHDQVQDMLSNSNMQEILQNLVMLGDTLRASLATPVAQPQQQEQQAEAEVEPESPNNPAEGDAS